MDRGVPWKETSDGRVLIKEEGPSYLFEYGGVRNGTTLVPGIELC